MSIKYDPTQKMYSVREARAHFSALIQESHDFGQPIIIAKYDQPIAYIIPYVQANDKNASSKERRVLHATRGMWKDRSTTTGALARKLRDRAERHA